jgi:uncharacterized protein
LRHQYDHYVKEEEMARWMSTKRVVPALLGLVVTLAVSLAIGQRAFARENAAAPATQSSPSSHTISVSGHGESTATPDMATITVGVQTKANDAQAALASNSTRLNAVVAAIQGQGVAADHIKTSDLSLYLDSQTNDYQASHQLTISLDSVSKVGSVLDAAVAAGANNSWGVSFGLKDASSQRSQALTSAVADARKRASAMAAALGVSVIGVGSASEASYSTPPIQYGAADRAPNASSAATVVQPGQLTVSADVNVVYTFG